MAPVAAATARSTDERQRPFSAAASPATALVVASRTAPPKIPACTTVWLAPVPIWFGGRSAVSASSGTPA